MDSVYTNEEWRVIPWSNGLYYASNYGRIKRVVSVVRNNRACDGITSGRIVGGRILSPKTKKNGYMEVNLYTEPQKGKMSHVHRAVYFSFNPNSDMSLQINHINCDKSDNRLCNLELVDSSQNMFHSYANGRVSAVKGKYGELCPTSKLNNLLVNEIRLIYSKTRAITDISKKYGISKSQVQRIVKRQSWPHI